MTQILIVVIIFFIGVVIGTIGESDGTYIRCVKANQNVPVGQIKQFCDERLYRN